MVSTVLLLAAIAALAAVQAARGRDVPAARGRNKQRPRARALAIPLALLLAAAWAAPAYDLRKLLGSLVMPLGLVWLGLLGAGLWSLGRKRRRGAALLLAACGFVWLVGNPWFATGWVRWLEAPFRQRPSPPSEPLDAIVVLGGGSSLRPWGEPQLSPAGDRIATAARFHRRGWARHLVCTGSAHRSEARGELPSAALLRELGVPDTALVQIRQADSTSDEIRQLAGLVRERGWQRVGLVTSAWHMRRALGLAERESLALVPLPADFQGGTGPVAVQDVVPSAAAAWKLRLAAWEVVGMTVGR